MKNKQLWITVGVLTLMVIFWGFRMMLTPKQATLPAESFQNILMEHVAYLPEVYRAHQNHPAGPNEDTCSVLIYRYSPFMCVSCYVDDISELKDFQKKNWQGKGAGITCLSRYGA